VQSRSRNTSGFATARSKQHEEEPASRFSMHRILPPFPEPFPEPLAERVAQTQASVEYPGAEPAVIGDKAGQTGSESARKYLCVLQKIIIPASEI